MTRRLGVGFIGSGFMTRFHIRSWQAVRDGDVRGVWSPNPAHAEEAAALARELRRRRGRGLHPPGGDGRGSGDRLHLDLRPEPHPHREHGADRRRTRPRRASCVGVACEKPLGRNAAEAARMVELVERSGLLHGYLENQLFAPAVERGKAIVWARGAALAGRPYLARAAEEHGGPHMPWFWRGDLQGGGVLNDMMCHSLEVGRYLLTEPGAPRDSIRPTEVSAPDRDPEMEPAGVRAAAAGDDVARGGLRPPPVGRLRARHGEVRGRGRPAADRRGHHLVELRRRRPAPHHGAAGARVLDVEQHPRQRHQGVPVAASARAWSAKTWSRSRTPSRA